MLGLKNWKYFLVINIGLLGLCHLKIAISAAFVVTSISYLVFLMLYQIYVCLISFQLFLPQTHQVLICL